MPIQIRGYAAYRMIDDLKVSRGSSASPSPIEWRKNVILTVVVGIFKYVGITILVGLDI